MKSLIYFSFFSLLLFTACGGEPKPETETINWKRTGNEVVVRMEASPAKLNPILSTTAYETYINDRVFTYLLDADRNTFDFIPALAKALPVEEKLEGGGVAYHFEIHEEAVWGDGKSVTGHDYAFTIKAVFVPKIPSQRIRPYLALIKDIVVDESNPKKFAVITAEETPDAVEKIGNAMWVLPKHFYDAKGLLDHISCKDFFDESKIEKLGETDKKLAQFAEEFIDVKYSRNPDFILGSGPYRLSSWEDEKEIILTKKENWWGDKYASEYPSYVANPTRLIYKPIVDNVSAIASLRSEEIDAMHNIDPNEFLRLREDSDLTKVYDFQTPPFYAIYFLYLNTRQPKLEDKRVRQAVAHSIDMDQIIKIVYGGLADRLASPIHPSSDLYNKDLKPYAFNIEKAKQLLKEAGWEDSNNDGIVDKEIDGEQVELDLEFQYTGRSERQKNLGLLCEETAKKAGIKFTLKSMEYRTMSQNVRNGDFDIAPGGRTWPPVSWSPKQNWHTGGAGRTGFGNAETDALIDNIDAELDKEKRTAMVKDLQAIIYDEQPEIYLISPVSRVIVHKRFEWTPSPMLPGFSPNTFKLKE